MDKSLKITYIVCASILSLFLYGAASYFVLQRAEWFWVLMFILFGNQLSLKIFELTNDTKKQ